MMGARNPSFAAAGCWELRRQHCSAHHGHQHDRTHNGTRRDRHETNSRRGCSWGGTTTRQPQLDCAAWIACIHVSSTGTTGITVVSSKNGAYVDAA